MNIVLFEPEIPANTGNIGRTCVATGSRLHLIEPLGFKIDEKNLKRAGLDYWPKLDVTVHKDLAAFTDAFNAENVSRPADDRARIWYCTTKAKRTYSDVRFGSCDYIMFGPESRGIPEEILVENEASCIRIPMLSDIRSLNLSNAVAIVLYESLRQQGFSGLETEGELHRLKWS